MFSFAQAVYPFVLDCETRKSGLHAMRAGGDLAQPYLFPELHIDLADVFAEC